MEDIFYHCFIDKNTSDYIEAVATVHRTATGCNDFITVRFFNVLDEFIKCDAQKVGILYDYEIPFAIEEMYYNE